MPLHFSDAFVSSDESVWSFCGNTVLELFFVVTICGANHSLLWSVCHFWQSEITCQSMWVLLWNLISWIFSVDEVYLLAAGTLFYATVYCTVLFWTNGKLITACAPENYSQVAETYKTFYRAQQGRSWMYYTMCCVNIRRVIHFLFWWLHSSIL